MASKNLYCLLSSGRKVPLVGLGTARFKNKPGEVRDAVKVAIDVGYRHFDGAYLYQNERQIGEALEEKIKDGMVKREDLFITSKLWSTFHRPDKVENALRQSLEELQLDFVDLYLMHSPMAVQYTGDKEFLPLDKSDQILVDDIHYTETWQEMEKLVTKDLTKSIGVSNFKIAQLSELLKIAKEPIAINQIENHPFIDQRELIDFCKLKGITIAAYSPLGSPSRRWRSDTDPDVLRHLLVKEVADSKGCSPAQLLVAYNICQGIICIPKSISPSRIQENFMVSILVSDQLLQFYQTFYNKLTEFGPRRTFSLFVIV
ncbi:Alcohol dehydrogenase [NADP(+)] A [Holothuria leucospilota]|uniref:Alcohol dehydrogenase [NADP(+)] A n=1 Tax=Holothuria leucospilota TaxID=206669 RepID=A0A9Q1BSH6_HOLLE|nr:Alcohol dehydrogenase [NADP(+)] A [Holothuria leucospilota]